MIFSFADVHREMSSGRSGFDKDLFLCRAELPDAFLECLRAGTPFLTLVESLKGVGEYANGIGEGMDLCLFAGESQLSSGRGRRTDLEGGLAIPCVTPVELDRVGMALGEEGFSASIWDVKRGNQDGLEAAVRRVCGEACENACEVQEKVLVELAEENNMLCLRVGGVICKDPR
jgi:hypothetical protein